MIDLGQFVNHNSYGIAALIAVVVLARWALRHRTARSIALLVVAAVVLVIPPLWLRSTTSQASELDSMFVAGQPALLELYSDL